jgi:hypothetical protein
MGSNEPRSYRIHQGGVMTGHWIVVNIGCIECGVSSNIVGVFSDEAEANAIAERLGDAYSWREGGQNSFEVFPMPPVNVVAEEYAKESA